MTDQVQASAGSQVPKIDKAASIWRRLLDRVFGYDFFISYSWNDGGIYAAALAARLEASGFQVFLDRTQYASGDDWKKVGAGTLRRTGQLILVGSPQALVSVPVLREIEIFSGTGRRIVPIDFGGSLEFPSSDLPIARYLPAEILRIKESADALTQGVSHEAVAAIRRTFTLVRQNQKRMGVFAGAALVLGVLAVAATWFGYSATINEREARRQKAVVDDRFTRLSVANGARLLDAGDVPGALLWFANPLSIHPKDETTLRQRLAATADTYPRLRQLLPHDTRIKEMQRDASGDRALTLSEDSSVRLWDLRSGSLLMALPKASPAPYAVALAADGKTFATLAPKPYSDREARDALKDILKSSDNESGSIDKDMQAQLPEMMEMMQPRSEISLFDVGTKALVRKQIFEVDKLSRIWSSPNGSFIVSGSTSMPIVGTTSSQTMIWRPAGSPETFTIPSASFDYVGFSLDAHTIVAADSSGAWQLLTSEGRVVSRGRHDVEAHGSLYAVAISQDGLLFATGDQYGKVILWDARTGKALGKPLEHGRAEIRGLAFSPDSRWIATTGGFLEDKAVRVWDAVTGRELLHYQLSDPGRAVGFDPSGRYLLATSRQINGYEGEARVWDVGTGLPVGPKITSVYKAEWTRAGRTIVTVGSDRTIKVWDLFGNGAVMSSEQQERLRTGKFSTGGKAVAAKGAEGLRLFPVEDFDRADFSLKVKQRSVWDRDDFAVNDKTSMMIEARDLESEVFDLTGQRSALKFAHKDAKGWVSMAHISAVEFSIDGTTVLIAGGDGSSNVDSGRVLVWNAATGKALCEPLRHAGYVSSASFSPDGLQIVSASRDGTAAIWSVSSCALLHRLQHDKTVNRAVFDRTGALVATAGDDGTARMWDTATGKPVGSVMRHENAVRFVAFSPDGLLLLTISLAPDGVQAVMRLWDVATHEVKSAPVPVGEVENVGASFSPDGRLIMALDGLHGFRVWDTATLEPLTPHLDDGRENGSSVVRTVPAFLPRARSLLPSQSNKGAPIVVGIGNVPGVSPRVKPWSLPPDTRETNRIVESLEAIASRRIDGTGALVGLAPDELSSRWNRAREAVSAAGKIGPETLLNWHRREVEECELTRLWFCVAWHVAQLAKQEPSAVDAALHLRNGRALAELERWSEADAEFGLARAGGIPDPQTVPQIVRLRSASGNAAGRKELVASLVEIAQSSEQPAQRLDALHATLVGTLPLAEPQRKIIVELAQSEVPRDKADPTRAEARAVLAAALYRSGRIDEALVELRSLKKDGYLRKGSVLLLAMAEWKAGDRAAAAELVSQAQSAMDGYAGIRRYEDGNHESSLYWWEWLELRVLRAEATQMMRAN